MATDPVCFMIVDEDTLQFKEHVRDTEYYFCCNYCKKQFDENPKRYIRLANDMTVDLGSGCLTDTGLYPCVECGRDKQIFSRAQTKEVPGTFTGILT